MKAQNITTVTTFERKSGATFLNQIMPEVKHVEIVKAVEQKEQTTVSMFWKCFWVIFWIVLFWPFAIVAFFWAGEKTVTTWTDGQYNLTMRDGSKLILTGNEDYLVAFINDASKKNFFNA